MKWRHLKTHRSKVDVMKDGVVNLVKSREPWGSPIYLPGYPIQTILLNSNKTRGLCPENV